MKRTMRKIQTTVWRIFREGLGEAAGPRQIASARKAKVWGKEGEAKAEGRPKQEAGQGRPRQEAAPSQAGRSQARPKPGDGKPGEAKHGEAKPGKAKTGMVFQHGHRRRGQLGTNMSKHGPT